MTSTFYWYDDEIKRTVHSLEIFFEGLLPSIGDCIVIDEVEREVESRIFLIEKKIEIDPTDSKKFVEKYYCKGIAINLK